MNAHKAIALDRIADTERSYALTDAAKTLGVRPKEFFRYLRGGARWIYRRAGTAEDVSYQGKLQRGLMEHKVATVTRSDGTEKTVTRARITAKGLAKLAMIFGSDGQMAAQVVQDRRRVALRRRSTFDNPHGLGPTTM